MEHNFTYLLLYIYIYIISKRAYILIFYIIFLKNLIIGVRDVFLPNFPLVLSLLKPIGIRVFLNQRNVHPKQPKHLK